MPEGDSIFRTARTLDKALTGHLVTHFESVFPAVTRVADDRPILGRAIESVTARGKHLLMGFSGDLTLHTHMRMNGSWHIYRSGERWRRSRNSMRLLVATESIVAVAFDVPVAELLSGPQMARHPQLGSLGPDPLGPAFDRSEAVRRIRSHASQPIGDVLLNQRVIAGIGNVLKSEILFVARINPFAPAASVGDDAVTRLLDITVDLMRATVLEPAQSLVVGSGRRTTRSLNPGAGLWVYGRRGKPCRRCGAPIESRKTGLDARVTCWCPRCQPST